WGRRSPGASPRSAGFAWLFSYFPSSPSHGPPHHLHSPSLLLGFRNELLDDFAESLDARWIVDLLPEHHGGGGDANDFSIKNFVAHVDEIPFVVRTIDHGDQTLLAGLDHALQLDFIDQEPRRSRRALARLQLRRGADQRLERITPSLRVVVVRARRGRLLEDFLQGLLHGRLAAAGGRAG